MTKTTTTSAIIMSIAMVLLAACGGTQSPTGAAGTMPQISRAASSSSYEILHRFTISHGGEASHPYAGLIDVAGVLYGTTFTKDHRNLGTVYSVSPSGTYRHIYSFKPRGGQWPEAPLLDMNGTLYGTTEGGGANCETSGGCGTVYGITTGGVVTILYEFKGGSDGAHPVASLVDVNGVLYGTTREGGNYACYKYQSQRIGCGTVFSVTTSGSEKVLHRFGGGGDGATPLAPMIDVKGTLYGTTSDFESGKGTIFSISTSGSEKVLYRFHGSSDGANPWAPLIDVNGMLYGTTAHGGATGNGTVYRISSSGAESVLYRFQGTPDGAYPLAALYDLHGTLYGTTAGGGAESGQCGNDVGCGTVYGVSTSGTETVLHSFTGGSDGAGPLDGLVGMNATLYGTTDWGGGTGCKSAGCGTVFALRP